MIVTIMLLLALSGGPEEPSYELKEVVTGEVITEKNKETFDDSNTPTSGQPGPHPK